MPFVATESRRFLSQFFMSLPADLKILIWCHPGKDSAFFDSLDAAVAHAEKREPTQNVYFCVSAFRHPPGDGRGKLEDTSGIFGLWADIDFLNPAHKKLNLPPNTVEARKLLSGVGAEPSFVIHSGHGLQAYWLFNKPWIFADDADRGRAATLSRRWIATLRACAARHGWTIDAVQDLTRVMRLPGTSNRKSEPVVPCHIIEPLEGAAHRYTIEFMDTLLIEEREEPRLVSAVQTRMMPQIAPVVPQLKDPSFYMRMDAMCKADPKLRSTWNRSRKDLPDQTPSSYDMSLASQLAAVDCDDQFIANAILARRQKHGEDESKALRRDYLMRTIAKARQGHHEERSVLALAATEPHDGDPGTLDAHRVDTLQKASEALGVHIKRFVRHGTENCLYSFELVDGTDLPLGTANDLMSPDIFREKLFDAKGVMFKPMKASTWQKIVQAIAVCIETVENAESTRYQQIVGWIKLYLNSGRAELYEGDSWKLAIPTADPFILDGMLHINTASLFKFVKFNVGEAPRMKNIWDMLRLIKFESKQVSVWMGKKSMSRQYWFGEASILDETEMAEIKKAHTHE